MRKYLLLVTLLLAYLPAVFSQKPGKFLQRLPTLRGKERIDCMLEIVKHYSLSNGYNGNDSAYYYCSLIYGEASKVGYEHAIALSLLGLHPESESLRIQDVKKAIAIGEELKDDEVLGNSYDVLQYLLFHSSNTTGRADLMKKSLYHFQKARDTLGEALLTHRLCFERNEEGFEYCKQSIQLSQQIRSSTDWEEFGRFLYFRSLDVMSRYYEDAGDYTTALIYMKQAHQAAQEYDNGSWGLEDGISTIFNHLGQYDSALHYLQMRAQRENLPYDPYVTTLLGETYLLQKNYEKAQQLFQKAVGTAKKNEETHYWHIRALLGLAKCFEISKDYKSAITSANEGFNISRRINDPTYTMDICALLARLYHQTGNSNSAYQYLQKYTILKDSATNKQNLWKFNIKLYEYKKEAEEARKEARLGFLDRDNKIKEEKLKRQAQLKESLMIGLLLLFLSAVFISWTLILKRRNEKLASEKKHSELQQKVSELEMQALRAQMNPHFIFNCLSSINRFIFKNETKAASDYLTRFSRLIRMVLMHSQRQLVPLEDELEMLRLYLDMERLRFKNAFDYAVTTTNSIESTLVFIPPLILQPFCENAIWHGLMHKEGPGKLNVSISGNNGILNCIIEDDGIGREKAAALRSRSVEREKSLGLQITAKRLALLNGENSKETFYEIDDIVNESGEVAGTRVSLQIKYRENIEQLV